MSLRLAFRARSHRARCLGVVVSCVVSCIVSCIGVGVWPGLASAQAPASDTARELREDALDFWIEREADVQRMFQRIAVAGLPLCGDVVAPVLGASILDIEKLHASLQQTARARYGEEAKFAVTHVFEGQTAEQGGLRPGDVVLEYNGREMRSALQIYANRRVRDTAPVLLVQRGDRKQQVELPEVPGCAYPAHVTVANVATALADGDHAIVTDAYWRLLEDDEMRATTSGHEMAHNILRHIRHGRAKGPWTRRRQEREADYMGMYLAVRAGYDVSYENWRRVNRIGGLYGFERGSTHPTDSERELLVKRVLEEIERKREAGLELLPEAE